MTLRTPGSLVDFRIPAPHGSLEAIYWQVPGARRAAVVCHPHPRHGGTMHNHVVFRIADACRRAGISALRFNFRGVGRSTGVSTASEAEDEDVLAALAALAAEEPGVPLWCTGFSFGSVAACRVGAGDPRVEALLAVGPPIGGWNMDFLAHASKPKAFIAGDQDEFCPDLADWAHLLPEPRRWWVVPGADHLFTLHRTALEATLDRAVAYLLDPIGSTSGPHGGSV
ncbi:MAG: alpha/beta hydrolase [Candidatus Sericytochromatia bacterium]|nr:alpha/beta hydrolase [Candidatus Tanganyikabacteria bacterium]